MTGLSQIPLLFLCPLDSKLGGSERLLTASGGPPTSVLCLFGLRLKASERVSEEARQ